MIVALSAGKEAHITLADGTELVAKRKPAGSPPAASGYAAVAADAIETCAAKAATEGCLLAGDEGGVARLRVTTPLALATSVAHDDVELSAKGPLARRIRWDVLRTR